MKNAVDLIALCKEKSITISSCESLTAGLFTSTIASNPGASAILKGGLVTYFTQMKIDLAHVDKDVIETYGVISQECAMEMAKKTRELTSSTYCVSFTGNAGPTSMEDKPAGCIYCSIASKEDCIWYHFQYDGYDRNTIRKKVVDEMINHLVEWIEKE